MNKKFLSAVLFGAFMLGTSVTFTGCIDNDEPAGIEELRGAKAELLKAKAAVEAAKVELVAAQARNEAAQAAINEAIAKQEEAEAKRLELIAELQGILNEEERARVEAQIAYYQNVMIENAEKLKLFLQQMESELAAAKRQHEVLIQQIEIAKALGSGEETVTLEWVENEVDKAYAFLYGGYYKSNVDQGILDHFVQGKDDTQTELPGDGNGNTNVVGRAVPNASNASDGRMYVSFEQSYSGQLRKAQEDLYNASLAKAEGSDEGDYDFEWIPSLELAVENAESDLAAAQEALAKVEEFLDEDVETTDWRAEIIELEDSLDALAKAISEKNVELKEAQKSESYLAADQAVNGVKKDGTVVKPGTSQILAAANTDLTDAVAEKKFKIGKFAIETPITGAMETAMGTTLTASVKALNRTAEKEVTTSYNKNNGKFAEPSEIKALGDAVTALGKIKEDLNSVEWAETFLAGAEKDVEEADSLFEVAVTTWETAKAVYIDNKPATVATKPVDDAITAYNKAQGDLVTAADAYTAAWKAEYDKAAEKKEAELKWNIKKEILHSVSASEVKLDKVKGFNHAGAKTAWDAIYGNALVEEKDFNKAMEDNCPDEYVDGETKYTKAQIYANVVAAIDAYIAHEYDWNDSNAEAVANAGKAAANAADLSKKEEAVTKAADALNKAYAGLTTGITKYQDAANALGMDLTKKEGSYILTAQNLVDSTTKVWKEGAAAYEYKNGVCTVKQPAIVVADASALLALVIDEVKAEKAFEDASLAAFGVNDRILPLDPAGYAALVKAGTIDPATDASALGALVKAEKVVADYEAQIAAAADIKTLAEELTAEQTALKTAFDKWTTDTFGELLAAVADAKADDDAARKVLKAENDKQNPINIEIGKLQAKKEATDAVAEELIKAVEKHLGLDIKVENGEIVIGGEYDFTDTESFIEQLEAVAKIWKADVATEQQKVAQAEVALQKAQEGKYDALADAQLTLDQIQAEYDNALADYNKALENLNKVLEALSAE